MMRYLAAFLLVLCACDRASDEFAPFGIDLQALDVSVHPGDDFYDYVNGSWRENFEIPADRSRYGVFTRLAEQSERQVHEIAVQSGRSAGEGDRIAIYYEAFTDMERIEARGLSPLLPYLERIAAVSDRGGLADLCGMVAYMSLFSGWVDTDIKHPERYVFYLSQAGLGMPDRDFYLEDGPRFVEIRTAYVDFLEEMLDFAGYGFAREMAHKVMALETEMARRHWDVAKRRDRDLTYNPMSLEEIGEYAPDFPVERIFAGLGEVSRVIVREPDAVSGLLELARDYDLEVWKGWLSAHLVDHFSSVLPEEVDQASFSFFGRTLRGQPERKVRWKRGVRALDESVGEEVGEIYVRRHYSPESQERMGVLVENVRAAFRQRIESLSWMGERTREEALRKLEKFVTRIGHPDSFESYEGLEFERGRAFENLLSAEEWHWRDMVGKLGQPVDRGEWFMTPQTVNAYYAPNRNEIVFPAAILQPPFFNTEADTAVNYGAIGAVIGHEMGHGFDDQGSKLDGDGVLRDWWSEEDRAGFRERTRKLVEQFSGFSPIEGHRINGELTLGENIGDLGGLSIAYHAYRLSLGGEEAPVVGGFTGDQRFFMSWAQVWRALYREEALLQKLRTDSHSPPRYRVNGIVRNMDAWYEAFSVSQEHELYLPPEQRVSIW